jgi:predicted phosphodiesterase
MTCNYAFSQVIRMPFFQIPTPHSIVARWQTVVEEQGGIYYGKAVHALNKMTKEKSKSTDHELAITGLAPNTKYYYSTDSNIGKDDQYFFTAPEKTTNTPLRIWVISDFGQTNSAQNARRLETVDRWRLFNNNSYHASFVLSLGDQTEDDSLSQIQHNYFDQLGNVLKTSPLYTLIGNHDNHDQMRNYLTTFSLPSEAEVGGVASHTEKYYSFNYGNVHVVMLCTEINEDDALYNKQITWLKQDLAANHQKWLIACMHQPFHSAGYHPTEDNSSAQKRRKDWLTLLEDYGVDVVLQGHNHVYERSFLVDNVIGKTANVSAANLLDTTLGRVDDKGPYRKQGTLPHRGTIIVSCTGGGVANAVKHYHEKLPIFPVSFPGADYEGSLVIDVNNNRMDVKFLCNEKNEKDSYIWDYFTILKKDVK